MSFECTKHIRSLNFQVNQFDLKIEQLNQSGEHGTTVWDSSKVLSLFLIQMLNTRSKFEDRSNKYCLELGSGCGLAGLSAASTGVKTILTDLNHIVPLLKQNISINKYGIEERWAGYNMNQQSTPLNYQDQIQVRELNWLDFDKDQFEEIKFDYILAADCIYEIELIPPFLQAVIQFSSFKTQIFVSLEPRDPRVIDAFVEESKKHGFSVVKIPRSKYPSPYNTLSAPCNMYKLKKTAKI
ncbi:hypothetical protein CONCODRAFT_72298 [Conidiobolus coronatus NRRL 28638]|uniref:Uncharacterized protein n=1 Tax=Conidiobolus coronatus (strain ATCC 28846 / CBS 209.66 / NRRL 28638) TaxID=796925 RepID=A0A137NZW6_CONC2|nr:hypothetical protein CONCODRAFT_72298 [Conidiobolus coronatus NRRL 28638]|eukprot:KXN68370.1 hypothetical protein CONCODRAFT_72298 [Conidiobolus coronatus NRRL 28638]